MGAEPRRPAQAAKGSGVGDSRRGIRRAVLRWTFSVVYAVSATLLLLELCVRLLLPQPLPQPSPEIYRPDPEIGWRRKPDVRVVANTGERDVEICTDGQGDRIECGAGAPSAASCKGRILILGDSFVEALAIPFSETVWGRLQRATGACTSVAGVGGYGPQQYARQARERLGSLAGSFDLVMLNLFAGNDFTNDADTMPGPEEVESPRPRLLPEGLSAAALWGWLYPYNEWLESHSHVYVAGRFVLMQLLRYDDVRRYGIPPALLRSGLSETHLAETTRLVERIATDTQATGAKLLVNVIPMVNQVVDPQSETLASRSPTLQGNLDMDLVSRLFVPRLSSVPGVDRVVDLLPYLRAHADEASWGRRDRHFSPRGHELWFDAIREPVEQLLAKP